jgi:hypothetical protein
VAALAAVACALLGAGCGEGGGVAKGATVTAYVAAPLCAGAKREASESGEVDSVRVQVACLPNTRNSTRLNLATVGANARRATEDSTTIAYLEAPEPAASRFTHPILESAGIPWIESSSGEAAMSRLLHAVQESNSGSRASVREALNEP